MNFETTANRSAWLNLKIALFFFFVLIVTFYPVFESKFTNWDDPAYVTSNGDIRSLSPANIGRIFTSFCCGHYHPLTVLSFAAEYSFYKLSPFFYHADNLLLHYCNCLLLFWLLFLITRNNWISFFASLLFAAHPMHVESVAWVSGRKDVLFTLPYIASFISYIYYRQSNKAPFFALSTALFIMSLLAKESAVTLPLMLIAYDYFILGKINLKDKAVFIVLSLIIGIIAIYSEHVSGAMMSERHIFSIQTFYNVIYSFLFYIEKIFFPFNLSCFYASASFSKFFFLKTAAAASLLTVCYYYYNNRKEAAFALIFYLINIVLFFQLMPVGYAVVCDRYTYLPYIGLTMIIAGGINGFIERNINSGRHIIIAAMCLAALFAFCAFQRCRAWLDSNSLWSDAIRNGPSNDRAFANRGFDFMDNGAYDNALADLKRSAQLNFNSAKVHFSMGKIYFIKKQYDMAVESYANAIKVDPAAPDAYLWLGLAYNMMNKDGNAIDQFNAALRIEPCYTEAYFALGNTYFKIKQYEKAISSFTEGLKHSPDNFLLHNNRGYTYYVLGKYEQALADLNKAVELNPRYTMARKHLAEALKARKNY